MANVIEDASTPAVVTGTSRPTTLTTASFSPPANSLLLVLIGVGWSNNTIATATVADSGGHTWTPGPIAGGLSNNDGGIGRFYYTYLSSAPGAITVTGTYGGYGGTGGGAILAVRVLNNAASDQSHAATATKVVAPPATTDTVASLSITTTTPGSWVYGITDDPTRADVFTANAATSIITNNNNTSDGITLVIWKAAAVTGTPGAVTLGGTWNATAFYNIAAFEVLPAALSANVSATTIASLTAAAQAVGPGSVTSTSTAGPTVAAGAVANALTMASATVAAAVSVAGSTTSSAVVSATAVGPGSVSATTTAAPSVRAGAVVTKTTTAAPTVTATPIGPGAVSSTTTASPTITGHRTQVADIAASETASPSVAAAAVGPADVFTASTAVTSTTATRTDTCAVSASSSAGATVAATAVGPAQINATATASPNVAATVPGRGSVVATTTAGVTLTTARSDSTGVSMAVLANPAITAVRSDTAAVTAVTTANPAVDGVRTAYADVAASVAAGVSVVGTRVHLAAVEAITAVINLLATGVRINPTGPMVATAVRLVGWAVAPDIEVMHSLAGQTTATSAATAIRVRTTTGVSADVDLLH